MIYSAGLRVLLHYGLYFWAYNSRLSAQITLKCRVNVTESLYISLTWWEKLQKIFFTGRVSLSIAALMLFENLCGGHASLQASSPSFPLKDLTLSNYVFDIWLEVYRNESIGVFTGVRGSCPIGPIYRAGITLGGNSIGGRFHHKRYILLEVNSTVDGIISLARVIHSIISVSYRSGAKD